MHFTSIQPITELHILELKLKVKLWRKLLNLLSDSGSALDGVDVRVCFVRVDDEIQLQPADVRTDFSFCRKLYFSPVNQTEVFTL